MSNAEKSFEDWYFNNGADWNAAHVKPAFIAGWKAAIKAAAEQAEKEVMYDHPTSSCIRYRHPCTVGLLACIQAGGVGSAGVALGF